MTTGFPVTRRPPPRFRARVLRRVAETRAAVLYMALVRAAALWVDAERARELAGNLAGCAAEDVNATTIRESIDRRRAHFGLEVDGGDAGAAEMTAAIHAAWKEHTA